MATNLIEEGKQVAMVAQAATVKGRLVVWNAMFGIPIANAASAENVVLALGGVWSMDKMNAASNSFAVGSNVYWDATNSKVTQSATSNTRIGVAVEAAGNTATIAKVRLNYSF